MGDSIIGTGLAIAQVGLGIFNGIAQTNNANRQRESEEKRLQNQAREVYSEVTRQQGEVSRIATEQVSDRVRAANIELGAARVAALERGVSGTTMEAITRNIAYLEGADIARIYKNRDSNIAQGESQKRSAKNGFLEGVNIAANQANAQITNAWLSAAGSGLAIAGNYFNQQSQLAALQNRTI